MTDAYILSIAWATRSDGRVKMLRQMKSRTCSPNSLASLRSNAVLVPHADGRAGCAAVVLQDEKNFDFKGFGKFAVDALPRYAVPIFLRVTPEIQLTGTMKMQKGKMRNEGCDVGKVEGEGDKLFWMRPEIDEYVRFRGEDWDKVREGGVKL
jgi:hypothetical protein